MSGQHLGIPDNSNPNSPDYVNPHDGFNDIEFEKEWADEVEQMAARLAEIRDEMRDEFKKCSDWCDHIDELSDMYNAVQDAAQSLEDYKPAKL